MNSKALIKVCMHFFRHSWVESSSVTMKGSATDLANMELDSASSTPGIQRVGDTFFIIKMR